MSSAVEQSKNTIIAFDCICRCCLTNKTELRPIFTAVGSIPQAIFLFTAVEVRKDDGFPGNICVNCLQQLNKCLDFKRKVEGAAVYLRKSLITNSSQKIIVEDGQNSSNVEETSHNTLTSSLYTCNVCSRSYGSKCAYNRHVRVHTPKENTFRCNVCGKRFIDLPTFEDHQICHNQEKTISGDLTKLVYTCQICKDVFMAQEDLFVHTSLHDEVHKCKSCGKNFANLAKLKRHIPRHFIEKPFKCKECNMGFSEMASLSRHYQRHTRRKPAVIHICSICGKSFPNPYSLKVHTRVHTADRPWECTKCNKRFTDFRLLNSHKKLHSDEKPHKCDQCKKWHRSTLITHMWTHTGDRPFRCDKCKKSYRQSWSLQIHKRKHAIAKQFVCKQCHQVFSTAASLRDHMQWHSDQAASHDQDPQMEYFQCKWCSAQLLSRLDFITHEKLTHTLSHECDTCCGKWKTLEELVQHKCDEALQASDEPTPDTMILLPSGEVQDCTTVVNALLASISDDQKSMQHDWRNKT